MDLFTPTSDEIRDQQDRDGRWYFSAAFGAVLRRHGVVLSRSGPTMGFVSRQTPWRDNFESSPLVFEGPLHATVARHFGIDVREQAATELIVRNPGDYIVGRLEIPRIRPARRERIDLHSGTQSNFKWETREFEYQELALEGDEQPLLFGDLRDGDRTPIAVRRGRALLLGIPLLDLMARYDAMPPYDSGYPGVDAGVHLADLESWLIGAAEVLFADSGVTLFRMGRWPHPYRWAVTVRHDVDRPLDRPSRRRGPLKKPRYSHEIRRRLRLYRKLGYRSTWFWLVSSIHPRTMRRIARSGHEVALHTEATTPERLREELSAVARALHRPVSGMTAHGGSKAPGHLGLHHVEWALQTDLEYAERVGGGFFLGCAIAPRDEIPALLPLMLPGQHIGTEKGTDSGQSNLDAAADWLASVVKHGGHAVVMNHPDVHFDTLRNLLNSLDKTAWSATMAEVAHWGRTVQFAWRTAVGIEFPSPLPYPANLRVGRGGIWSQLALPTSTTSVRLARDGDAVATTVTGEQIRLIAEPLPAELST